MNNYNNNNDIINHNNDKFVGDSGDVNRNIQNVKIDFVNINLNKKNNIKKSIGNNNNSFNINNLHKELDLNKMNNNSNQENINNNVNNVK